MIFKSILFYFVLAMFILSCGKDKEPTPNNQNAIAGGTGGSNHLVVFTRRDKAQMASRVWLKYAAKLKPADTSFYNEVYATMTEPGYGPHAHFNGLKLGFYYLHAEGTYNGNLLLADSTIEISSKVPSSWDITLTLK